MSAQVPDNIARGLNEKQIDYVVKLHNQLANVRTKITERAGVAMTSGLTIGAGAAAGYVDGRYPDKKILGLDLSLVFGIAAAGYAYTQTQGSYEERAAMAVANGALAGYGYQAALAAGAKARAAAPPPAPAK